MGFLFFLHVFAWTWTTPPHLSSAPQVSFTCSRLLNTRLSDYNSEISACPSSLWFPTSARNLPNTSPFSPPLATTVFFGIEITSMPRFKCSLLILLPTKPLTTMPLICPSISSLLLPRIIVFCFTLGNHVGYDWNIIHPPRVLGSIATEELARPDLLQDQPLSLFRDINHPYLFVCQKLPWLHHKETMRPENCERCSKVSFLRLFCIHCDMS